MKLSLITLIGAAALAFAAPVAPVQALDVFCDKNGLQTVGDYTVYNNLWGQDGAKIADLARNAPASTVLRAVIVVEVKSYANAICKTSPVALSAIESLSTSWGWTYTGNDLNANVAYDMFIASAAGAPAEFEVMVWPSAMGPKAVPIGGTLPPIAEVNLVGSNWKLYHGMNGNMNVYSFVATSQLTWFSADLMVFLNYMADNQRIPKSQILQSVYAGTEAFTGWDAVFTTSSYTLSQYT